jgi:hypothetical protein
MMIVFAILILALVLAIIRMARKPRITTFFAIIFEILVIVVLLGPLTNRIDVAQWSAAMQTGRTIALAESQYADDHDGRYPDGNSSTEVFQKLLDGNYVSDPMMFYLRIPGKTSPSDAHLKPENVAYDVTSGMVGPVPDGLPLVIVTGYKIDYRHGGKVTSLDKPRPIFLGVNRAWIDWLNFKPKMLFAPPVIIEMNGRPVVPEVTSGSLETDEKDDALQDFKSQGKTYRQLTPNGPLL